MFSLAIAIGNGLVFAISAQTAVRILMRAIMPGHWLTPALAALFANHFTCIAAA
jgi:hypothetical protein